VGRKKTQARIREDVLELFRAWGSTGGKAGGKLRWKGVSPEERSRILRKAVQARWSKARKQG